MNTGDPWAPDVELFIEQCPCCSGDTETGKNWSCGMPYVRCVSCGLLMEAATLEEAIKRWNRRPEDEEENECPYDDCGCFKGE